MLLSVCRHWWAKVLWAVWPAWVWFAVMATGNHFWLDCMAGIAVALLALTVVYNARVRRLLAARRGVTDRLPTRTEPARRPVLRSAR